MEVGDSVKTGVSLCTEFADTSAADRSKRLSSRTSASNARPMRPEAPLMARRMGWVMRVSLLFIPFWGEGWGEGAKHSGRHARPKLLHAIHPAFGAWRVLIVFGKCRF